MVNQCDAPFRTLCLCLGTTVAYTEMFYSDRVVHEEGYLTSVFPDEDHSFFGCVSDDKPYSSRPLIAQVCGNDPAVLGKACEILAATGKIDGIDLNLGCPQQRAKEGGFGAYLLDTVHWETVFNCVRSMSAALDGRVALSCKIRILDGFHKTDSFDQTIEFCEGLVSAGAQLITVHGRTRGSARDRRCGPADISFIERIAAHFKGRIPVVANGNIVTRTDTASNLLIAPSIAGVMSGEGILADPAIFSLPVSISMDRCQIFEEYCYLSELYERSGGWQRIERINTQSEPRQLYIARQHLLWMLGKKGHGRTVRFGYLGDYSKHSCLLEAVNSAVSLIDLIVISRRCLRGVQTSDPFSHDVIIHSSVPN